MTEHETEILKEFDAIVKNGYGVLTITVSEVKGRMRLKVIIETTLSKAFFTQREIEFDDTIL